MNGPSLTPLILCESDLESPRDIALAGGTAVVFSRRCPGRDSVNEDSAAAVPVTADSGVLMVADGVGGMQSGQHASAQAVRVLSAQLQNGIEGSSGLRSAILDGLESANRVICGMNANAATTMALIEVQGDRVRPYHVGDSSILLCGQRGRLVWQSIAHSPLGYAVESGMMDEADAMLHPDRHVVSNVIGCPEMRIEIGPPLCMKVRDTLVLCSDGLSDNLSTDEIIAIVRRGSLAAAVGELVRVATERMINDQRLLSDVPSKPDDLTIIAFRRSTAGNRRNSATKAKNSPTGTVPL